MDIIYQYSLCFKHNIILKQRYEIQTLCNTISITKQSLLLLNAHSSSLHTINLQIFDLRNQTKVNNNDRSFGKQLPYTPLHKMQWNLRAEKDAWGIYVNQVYTGERFDTTDNESVVDPYILWNTGISYQWNISQIRGSLGFHVFNLLDEQYQAMKLRAMPGRNYQVNLSMSL